MLFCLALFTDVFSIDASTGILTLESSLNYETMSYFEFEVTVTNTGSSSMKDTSTVNVTVVDTNDNSPIFQTPPFPYSVGINLSERNYTTPFSKMLYTVRTVLMTCYKNGITTSFSLVLCHGQ